MSQEREKLDLSVVAPLYNEGENVLLLHKAIDGALAPTGLRYEILFVDDGSSDNTFELAATLTQQDPHLRVIKFRRNYGQTPAMVAGIDHARAEVVITMDGDLQNDPQDIPLFLEKMAEGYDMVVGWRHNRQDKLVTRKIPSRIANWLIGKVTGVPIRDNGCSLKAYRAELIKNTPLYSEMHRFIPAMASVSGARIAQIRVRHHARQFGESKYGLSRVYKVLFDLLAIKAIVSFSARPMLWFATLAIPAMLVAVVCLSATAVAFAQTGSLPLPIAGSGVLFAALAGQLVLSGLLGELVHQTGDLKLERLAALTRRLYGTQAAEKAQGAVELVV